MRVVFAVIGGPHTGKSFAFEGHEMFLVGRSKQAHFRLAEKDEYFSRNHFLVEVNPPQCRLVDLGSTNGTYVNGQRVVQMDLKDGDLIEGGETVMRVCLEEDAETATRVKQGRPPASDVPPMSAMPVAAEATANFVLPPPRDGPCVCACQACGAPAPAAEEGPVRSWPLCGKCHGDARLVAQAFPGFRVVRKIGEGGMGVVYLSVRVADGRRVALKTLRPAVAAGAAEVQRFLREVSILGKLRHPNIVALLDVGELSEHLYFVMEHVSGVDGAELVRREGPLDVGRAVRITCQLLDALGYAHGEGFVQRDVKPGNLMVSDEGGREVVRVLDFGLARAYQDSKLSGLTLAGSLGGSAPFMAPEQIRDFRGAGPSVDQYAAAATLYFLLTGKYTHEFPRDFQGRLGLLLTAPHVPLPKRREGLPAGLVEVLDRALAKEPTARFADVGALRQALLPYA